MHREKQYLNLIRGIIQNGEKRIGRNGITYSIFGTQMRFSLRENKIPFITTKKLAWKTCLKELLWFVRGETNNKLLKEQNVHIWDGNGSNEFLQSRGLNYEEDDLGPIYGFQWRNFNGDYNNCLDYNKNGIDQINYIIESLQNDGTNNNEINQGENKYSRRLIVSAWNPIQINKMALPPCHVMFQFYVNQKDELSCCLYQRSGDVGLGVPFNIASYSMLVYLLAKHCNLKCGDFIHTIGDAHIYEEHIESLEKQIRREPYDFPFFHVLNKKDNIDDYNLDDFKLTNYKYHPTIKMNMSV